MKKCVIIGSGLGGLACGSIMAKNGYDVTILEQGSQAGGCLQCFRRKGVLFDTGMHYIGSADTGQTLYAIARYLEIDASMQLQRLDPEGYDIISMGGRRYALANGKQRFIDTLAAAFPDSRADLERYYNAVERVTSAMPIHTLSRTATLNYDTGYQLKSVGEVLAQTISNPALRNVISGISPLYAGEQFKTPFTTHALIADFYHQSAYRIVGGSDVVSSSLRKTIEKYGGSVILRKKVIKIGCDDRLARYVECADGTRYDADVVISDIHPAVTIDMVAGNLIRPAYRRRLEAMDNTVGVFTVYLKFKKDSVPYMNHNLYVYRTDDVWSCADYDEASWPRFMLYMHFCHKLQPTYAETAEILTYMRYDDVRQWENTTVGHREDAYEAFKRRKAERIIALIEAECPELKGNIETYYTSTPLTYRDYTGTPEGAMYGIARNVKDNLAGHLSARTRIPNLLLTGQSITLHGMLGVLAGSIVTCSQLLSLETIFNQMGIE